MKGDYNRILILDCLPRLSMGKSLADALVNQGADAIWVNAYQFPKKPLFKVTRPLTKLKKSWMENIRRYSVPKFKEKAVINRIKEIRPDYILVVGYSYKIITTEALLACKKELGFKLLLWDTDSGNFIRHHDRMNFFVECELKKYDGILSFSKSMGSYLQSLLDIPCYFFSYGAPVLSPMPEVQKDRDLFFAGNRNMRRLVLLGQLKNYEMAIYGEEWEKIRKLIPHDVLPSYTMEDCFGDKLIGEISRSKIILNITNQYLFSLGTGINLRIPEVMSMGGFLLSDHYEELDMFYSVGKDLETFKTMEELTDKVDFYLKNDAAREKVAKQGRETVLKYHTWDHRAREFLDIVKTI